MTGYSGFRAGNNLTEIDLRDYLQYYFFARERMGRSYISLRANYFRFNKQLRGLLRPLKDFKRVKGDLRTCKQLK